MSNINDSGGHDAEEQTLQRVKHLLEDAEREGEIAKKAAAKEEADLAKAKRELEELRHHRATVAIVVNGTQYEVQAREHIAYSEVVTLAHPDYPQHPEITYSVTFTKGPREKPEGILPPGGNIKVKEGMSFRVNRTGQS